MKYALYIYPKYEILSDYQQNCFAAPFLQVDYSLFLFSLNLMDILKIKY